MKGLLKPFFILVFTVIASSFLPAQSNQFNIENYKAFLQSHQNISSGVLLGMHSAGKFLSDINLNEGSINYLDSISLKYNLTEFEKSLIKKHGFMVSERLAQKSFGSAMLDIFQNDMPLFVSTDAILQALHISYDRILKDVELAVLINKVKELLMRLHSQFPELAAQYAERTAMLQMLHDVDIYISVPLKLLGEEVVPYFQVNTIKFNEVISKITAEQGYDEYSLFSETPVVYDWSQFKPRGHYVDIIHPELENYFRTMIWLGRTEIYLLPPRAYGFADSAQVLKDIRRQTIDAFLFAELFEKSNVHQIYNEIEKILTFFVGDQDNVTISNLEYLKNAVSVDSPANFLEDKKLFEFQDSLKNQAFAYQLILSQILFHDPMKPDSIIPASSFLLFGQRYIIDSYINSQVVYDKTKTCRLFPSSLDPMFALGNNAAAQLLTKELDQYGYSENLAAVRYLVDSYGQDFWQATIYNLWLNLIRTLNPPDDRTNLPAFMQTAAFWQEKLNTQLSSWTQLRHDNLLYAKQSYTGGTLCSYPYTYIEPFPEFYQNLKVLSDKAQNYFSPKIESQYDLMWQITEYFKNLGQTADTLYAIVNKELSGADFNESETDFLKRVVYNQSGGSGSVPYAGWYPKLFFRDNYYHSQGFLSQDDIVADIHTIPTDCFGNIAGWVQHVGTGPVNLGVFVADMPGGVKNAFIGPVLSYYEYTTTNFQRLNDQEWKDSYLKESLRPDWTNLYLAGTDGNTKGEGAKLITAVKNNDRNEDKARPEEFIYANIYPNPATPFNPTVAISFSIPSKYSGSYVELKIYDIQGRLVKNLVEQNLPSGKFIYRWDGKNEKGFVVASGVYISTLRIAERQFSRKLMLMK